MTIMKRRARSCFAFVAMLGLLFAQLSLTAYACRMLDGEAATPVVAAVPMTDCADMVAAQANANLCEVHCQDGIKSTLATTGDVPPTVVLSFISSAFATNPRPCADVSHAVRDALAAAPPLPIRFCRFLI